MIARTASAPTFDDLREKRDRILEIARRRGATDVRVFGSVAHGTSDEASDVDTWFGSSPDEASWTSRG